MDQLDGMAPAYPTPGSEIPDQPGYVVGTCGHRLAGSEWRAGFRTCERCGWYQPQVAAEPDQPRTSWKADAVYTPPAGAEVLEPLRFGGIGPAPETTSRTSS